MKLACTQLIEEFGSLIVSHKGDLKREIVGRVPPKEGRPGYMVFLDNPRALREGLESQAEVVVVNAKFWNQLALNDSRTFLATKNISLLMAKVTRRFFWEDSCEPYENVRIHPTSIVAEGAELGSQVILGPHVVIGRNVKIGAHTFIGANTVIDRDVTIGSHCRIFPLVHIGSDTRIGNGCTIHSNTSLAMEGYGFAHDERGHHFRIPQTGRVIIEDDVEIGSHCSVDKASMGETRIGCGTKMDNLCHIGHNCSIGRHSLITAGFVLAGSTHIGDHFVCGGHTTVNGHITIADHVHLGGRSVVQQSVKKAGAYSGHPLEPVKDHLRTVASLRYLTAMRRLFMKKQKGSEDLDKESSDDEFKEAE